jgi:hypothetical protein
MKATLHILIAAALALMFQSCRSTHGITSQEKEEQLWSMMSEKNAVSLRVQCRPEDAGYMEVNDTGHTQFEWTSEITVSHDDFSTSPDISAQPIVVEEWGHFFLNPDLNGRIVTYGKDSFERAFACPSGVILPGKAYTNRSATVRLPRPTGGYTVFYVVGRQENGQPAVGEIPMIRRSFRDAYMEALCPVNYRYRKEEGSECTQEQPPPGYQQDEPISWHGRDPR